MFEKVNDALFATLWKVDALYIRHFMMGGTTTTKDDQGVGQILNNMKTKSEGSTTLSPLTSKIEDIGAGAYRVAFLIATFVFVVGLIIFFVKMFTANSQERSFMKWDIVWKAAAIACAFGAIALVTLFATFGTSLFSTDGGTDPKKPAATTGTTGAIELQVELSRELA